MSRWPVDSRVTRGTAVSIQVVGAVPVWKVEHPASILLAVAIDG